MGWRSGSPVRMAAIMLAKCACRHAVSADQVCRRSLFLVRAERCHQLVLDVEDVVAITIDDYAARCAMDTNTALATVGGLAAAAITLPRDELVRVHEAGVERVVELPVIMCGVTPASRRDPGRKLSVQGPTGYVDFVRAVVQRFTRSPVGEPVPVVGGEHCLCTRGEAPAPATVPSRVLQAQVLACLCRLVCDDSCTRSPPSKRDQ